MITMMNLYPTIKAEPLQGGNRQDQNSYFLFSSLTNKGFVVDGLAAHFCKQIDGKKTLENLIKDFEVQFELESGKFNKDIETLLKDLSANSLISFNDAPIEE